MVEPHCVVRVGMPPTDSIPAFFQFADTSRTAGRSPLAPVEPVVPVVPVVPVEASLSEHDAVLPPLLPPQVQLHGPLPATAEVVPAVHRLAVGLVLTEAPFAVPHAPLTFVVEASLSEHAAVLPPLLPAQLHDHGPVPLTVDAVPAVQRLVVGLVPTVNPFDEPHTPLTALGDVEEAVKVA
jgi:hypothetical protein